MMEQENQTDLEDVIQEVENETPQEEVAEEKPELDLSKFDSADDPDVIKVDLSQPVTEETAPEEVVAEPVDENEVEAPALEEITDEVEALEEEVIEALDEAEETGSAIPESVQKLLDFMEDTGGDINDYVRLNRDVQDLDDQDALREYYKDTKPHLSSEEVDFLMEDQFAYDESIDDERDIKRRKLARKEQVAEAKAYLDGQKSKYYEEIKARDKRLTPEQQKAMDFFNRYNSEQEQIQKNHKVFLNQTNQVFNKDFKGFEYEVGEKKFRLNINDVAQVKETQSDANNLFKKFLNDKNVINDAHGYHKSIYTAMNPDVIAQHFYEQGKADAIKETVARDRNIQVNPRQTQSEVNVGGVKYRVLGDTTDSFKVKMRKRK
jgi:hypothetical protein